MSVHKDLIKHAVDQNKAYNEFLKLDELREVFIEEAIALCKQGQPFSTDKINQVTNQMNRLTVRMLPKRKYVTVEMVQEYVKSK
ncbi:Protein of unknown function [Mesobacillus persicus]|uniref:DUF2533 domain-containing protein n=1 Tax=Mesobacillus persicus TaxID=930146 RepID=A0A1H7W1D9_9BACI|nr:DUF2533 family protein [Mesobacillus persicus]SEM15316.1 Protein of unknown function [Mesobacillus persicus]